MGSIISLTGAEVEAGKPDQACIDQLEALLTDYRNGKYVGLAFVGCGIATPVMTTGWCGTAGKEDMMTL